MDIVDPTNTAYVRSLLDRHDDPVLLEMESAAAEAGFPIVGRTVGVTLELLARAIGARRIIELGSGFGYSAFWHARAVLASGDASAELHLTDGDAENERRALDYLGRAGLDGPVRFHVGDAVETLGGLDGEFDVVYDDIDKHGYTDAWRAARDRIRVGGLYVCDNVLWFGRVAGAEPDDPVTDTIRRHNTAVAADERYLSVIDPERDGLLVALRMA
ncbi:MAG: O-methyltransferase [Actinomycetota bacterium]